MFLSGMLVAAMGVSAMGSSIADVNIGARFGMRGIVAALSQGKELQRRLASNAANLSEAHEFVRRLQSSSIPAACVQACPDFPARELEADYNKSQYEVGDLAVVMGQKYEERVVMQHQSSCKNRAGFVCFQQNQNVCAAPDGSDGLELVQFLTGSSAHDYDCTCDACPCLPLATAKLLGLLMEINMFALLNEDNPTANNQSLLTKYDRALCDLAGGLACVEKHSSCSNFVNNIGTTVLGPVGTNGSATLVQQCEAENMTVDTETCMTVGATSQASALGLGLTTLLLWSFIRV